MYSFEICFTVEYDQSFVIIPQVDYIRGLVQGTRLLHPNTLSLDEAYHGLIASYYCLISSCMRRRLLAQ